MRHVTRHSTRLIVLPGLTLLSVVLALGLLAGCKRQRDAAQFFPPTAAGWQQTGNVRVFAAGDLWQYIDGAAEKYIASGVTRALTSDFRHPEQGDAVVDIFEFKSPDGARTMMEADTSGKGESAAIGDAARVFGQSVVFRNGRYLVRIVAYDEKPQTRKSLIALAQAVAAGM